MEFAIMYNQGMNVSPEDMMGARPGRYNDCRLSSSGSKRKHRGWTIMTVNVIHEAIDCTNDLLRAIAEWLKITRHEEDAIRREVIRQLQVIPQLSVLDSVQCMMLMIQKLTIIKAFLDLSDDIKLAYCNTILHNNP